MPVATTPVLQKQQNKPPTSMRYERVQDILSNDLALKQLLGPKNHPIDSRFGEKIMFSKEAVDVTNAIHAEGKDAHKVSKNEVLGTAMRILKGLRANGETRPPAPVAVAPQPPAAPPATIAEKKKQKPKPSPKSKPAAPPVTAPERQEQKSESAVAPALAPKPIKVKKQAPAKPVAKTPAQKAGAKTVKPVKVVKQPKAIKPEHPKPVSVPTKKPATLALNTSEANGAEDELPESELPPEKQPLHLPAAFDPKKYPHYDVQQSAYSMLLSTLTLVTHYEKYPGFEERQRKLELLLKDYLDTCNQIKIA